MQVKKVSFVVWGK